MNDNGFNRACPSGNHMENGSTPYDRAYPNVSIGDVVRNDNTGALWEVVDIDKEYVVLVPADDEISVTHRQFEEEFTA